MEPDPVRFPSLRGTPAERTRQLAQRTEALDWAGLGLWVAPQIVGDGRDGNALRPQEEVEPYWRERMAWSAAAGIRYWKVDWGWRDADEGFRSLLTRLAHEVPYGPLVEHAPICGPLNDEHCPLHRYLASSSGRFAAWDEGRILAAARLLLLGGDVYRTYDVTAHLSLATTLDRAATLLGEGTPGAGCRALVNVEDEIYLGAALG